MLSQIRQISDGNHNTVFVKNKEHKFNLDKEIHDLECWKQSRNHVYRKEERELLSHLDRLKQQQEYLHHLDEERSGHVRGSQTSSHRRHSLPGSIPFTHNASVLSPPANDSIQEMGHHGTPERPHPSRASLHTSDATLPPVISGTDKRTLHRAEAHTNICLICQLPRWTHGHPPGEAVCCCGDQEGAKPLTRRYTTTGHEDHNAGHIAPPIQIGQRRHSLMMARLNESQHEHKPHPPERGHAAKSQHHDHVNTSQDHVHIHRHVHNHVHMHHDHGHHNHHHGHPHHGDHVNNHARSTHGPRDSHVIDYPKHYVHHNGNVHTSGHAYHGGQSRGHIGGNGHRGSAHGSDHQRQHHHGNHEETHTPSNSPRRYSRQSIGHHDPHISNHDHSYPHPTGHQFQGRRHSTAGSLGPSGQEFDTRTRDHELHWDRHQVCKLKGMITDPHYKEQLEVESGRAYPWSGMYPPKKTGVEDFEDLKNCRYLRFSKLNLMGMKENPEEEVEVFEKETPPS